MLSEKRVELLQIIDKYGIVTRKQLMRISPRSTQSLVDSMAKLEELNFIATYKLARGYAHYITKKGSEYIGALNFGYVKSGGSPNLAILEHNLLVNDCIVQAIADIKRQGVTGEITVVSEREQLAEIFLTLDLTRGNASQKKSQKMKMRSRIPDFLLKFDYEGKPFIYAYEVELSRKNSTRLTNKHRWLRDQLVNKTYSSIHYMTRNEKMEKYLKENADKVDLPINFLRIQEEENV